MAKVEIRVLDPLERSIGTEAARALLLSHALTVLNDPLGDSECSVRRHLDLTQVSPREAKHPQRSSPVPWGVVAEDTAVQEVGEGAICLLGGCIRGRGGVLPCVGGVQAEVRAGVEEADGRKGDAALLGQGSDGRCVQLEGGSRLAGGGGKRLAQGLQRGGRERSKVDGGARSDVREHVSILLDGGGGT